MHGSVDPDKSVMGYQLCLSQEVTCCLRSLVPGEGQFSARSVPLLVHGARNLEPGAEDSAPEGRVVLVLVPGLAPVPAGAGGLLRFREYKDPFWDSKHCRDKKILIILVKLFTRKSLFKVLYINKFRPEKGISTATVISTALTPNNPIFSFEF